MRPRASVLPRNESCAGTNSVRSDAHRCGTILGEGRLPLNPDGSYIWFDQVPEQPCNNPPGIGSFKGSTAAGFDWS
jgi:hypothetical protein